jgi:two-component system response regulator (stage 0 sporulation protein A)
MNDLISVMIADDNPEFCALLHEYIDRTGDMIVKGTANNGLDAVELIRRLVPDVVVLDIIMPKLDGIGVLEKISEMPLSKRPICIVLSAIGKDAVVRNAIELGADYYIMKPLNFNDLASHIRRLYEMRELPKMEQQTVWKNKDVPVYGSGGRNLEQIVTALINNIGITPNLAGYRILREAVILLVNEPAAMKSISKYAYPVLAEKNKMTPRNIDRVIRCAINSARNKLKNDDNCEKITSFFSGTGKNPGNLLVLRVLAEKAIQMMNMGNIEQK